MAAPCLQSAVLGFGVFRVLERYGITSGLSIGENVILQTTSVATATMPLAAGKSLDMLRSSTREISYMRSRSPMPFVDHLHIHLKCNLIAF